MGQGGGRFGSGSLSLSLSLGLGLSTGFFGASSLPAGGGGLGLTAGFFGARGFPTGDFGLSGASGSLGLGLAAGFFGASGLPAGGGGGAVGFSLRGGGFRGGRTWWWRGFLGGLQAGGLAVGGGATRFLGAGARQSGVRLLLAVGSFGTGFASRDALGFGLVPGNACRFFFLSGLRLGCGVRFF